MVSLTAKLQRHYVCMSSLAHPKRSFTRMTRALVTMRGTAQSTTTVRSSRLTAPHRRHECNHIQWPKRTPQLLHMSLSHNMTKNRTGRMHSLPAEWPTSQVCDGMQESDGLLLQSTRLPRI